MKTKYVLFLLAASWVAFSSAAPAADWYVDPIGGGTGTSAASPMQPQYAINSATSGDRLFFAPGVYNVGASYGLLISISKDLTLQGAPGATLLDLTTSGINVSSGANAIMIGMIIENSATNDIEVRDGSDLVLLDSTVQNLTGIRAMLISSSSTARLENCLVDANSIGIVVSEDCDLVVHNTTFSNHTSAGIELFSATAATQIGGNRFVNNVEGIHIQPGYRNTESLIEGNYFEANQWGIAIINSGSYVAIDQIHHNGFIGSTTAAIYSGTGNNGVTIEGNYIQGNSRGIYLEKTSDYVTNNIVIDTLGGGGGGIGIQVVGGTARVGFNTVAYNAIDGIRASTGDASLYANNISYNNGNYGIRVMASPGAQVGFNNTFLNWVMNLAGVFVSLGGHRFVPPGFKAAYDFHLAAGSPMINAANWALIPQPVDYDGKARVAGKADIGAFER